MALLYDLVRHNAARMLENVIDRSKRWHEIRLAIDHFLDTHFIQEYAVFDRVDTSTNRIEDSIPSLCMTRTTLVEPVPL